KEIALVRKEVDVKTSEIKREIETKIAETNKEIALVRKEVDVKISGVETKIVEAKNSTIIWIIGSLGLLQTIFKALDYFLK
ncbi:hypothetical protein IT568_05815, partial [bacterium]|nr:hypothetical protein [bacterium]